MPGRELRVLLVAPTFGAYGGMEAFVLGLADSLGREPGIHARVCFKRARGFRLHDDLAAACANGPVEFCDRASAALWRAIAWSDLVHGQNASPDVAAIAALLRRPLALSIHNVLPATPRLRRLAWRAAAAAARRRWFNSRYVWRTWEPAPRPGSALRAPASRLAAPSVPPADRRGFLFLGRLVEGKGAGVLIDAYCRAGLDAASWPLTILGDGPLKPTLAARLRERGCRGVSLDGFITGDAKAARIARARWLVVPSHWQEPFGMVAVEARSLGVPVIATADGGLPEAAGRDALVCAPADVEALAAALARAAAMPDEEYIARAQRTRADLDSELPADGSYATAYAALTGRDGHR